MAFSAPGNANHHYLNRFSIVKSNKL